MKATAIAPANIAFIKYWGKKDETLRLPLNSSISMNLDAVHTTTTVDFLKDSERDEVIFFMPHETYKNKRPHEFVGLEQRDFSDREKQRVVEHMDRIRSIAKSTRKAKVVTKNSFPKSSGIASSASGFAALTVATAAALGLELSERELTILARFGSGSACRSIPDGFVLWQEGKTSDESYAFSLYPASHWDIRDLVVIVESNEKSVSSSDGMEAVKTSPFWKQRVDGIPRKIDGVRNALKRKDFQKLGEIIEEECVNFHAVTMTQKPALFYWNCKTIELIHAVTRWREQEIPVYFTIDAGSNVHLICEGKDEAVVAQKAKELRGVTDLIINQPAKGVHLISTHLF